MGLQGRADETASRVVAGITIPWHVAGDRHGGVVIQCEGMTMVNFCIFFSQDILKIQMNIPNHS